MDYIGEEISTEVAGQVVDPASSQGLSWQLATAPSDGVRIVFREAASDSASAGSVDFAGQYQAIVIGNRMVSVWVADRDGRPRGQFELVKK